MSILVSKFQAYTQERRTRTLKEDQEYLNKKIQECTREGKDFFIIKYSKVLAVSTWISIMETYTIDSVYEGWKIIL